MYNYIYLHSARLYLYSYRGARLVLDQEKRRVSDIQIPPDFAGQKIPKSYTQVVHKLPVISINCGGLLAGGLLAGGLPLS